MNGEQTTDQATSVGAPVAKVVSVWVAVKITSWADAASFVACMYTLILLGEWFWRRCGRPFLESRGWIARRRRRITDMENEDGVRLPPA